MNAKIIFWKCNCSCQQNPYHPARWKFIYTSSSHQQASRASEFSAYVLRFSYLNRSASYTQTTTMSARLITNLRKSSRPISPLIAARRAYADVADGKLQLSLVLPHQVSMVLNTRVSTSLYHGKLVSRSYLYSPFILPLGSFRSICPRHRVTWVCSPITLPQSKHSAPVSLR